MPVYLLLSKVTRLGKGPISLAVGGAYFLESPAGGPNWRLRSVVTLLFPG